jgi:hypothetical protein
MHETKELEEYELEIAAKLWPKSAFEDEKSWLEYVAKWLPKLPALNKALALA